MIEIITEKPSGILSKIKSGIIHFFRGYSEKDVETAQRIMAGKITPVDRLNYITEEICRLYSRRPTIHTLPDYNSIGLLSIGRIEEKIAQLQALPPEELDPKIRSNAQDKLRRWRGF